MTAGDPDATLYGTQATPTTAELARVPADEGGTVAAFGPSGLAAITTAILSVVRPGDHLLVVDSVYGPVASSAMGRSPAWA